VFKRLFWLGLGASLGVGGSWWVTRTVRQKILRYAPKRLTSDLATKARSVGGDVRAAVADGRQAMRDQEDHLRAQLEARYAPPNR
jgi:putative heme iron utilization protein